MTPHSFKTWKGLPWLPTCERCWLVRLRNKATDWCVSQGCEYKEQSNYQAMMRELTRQ